MVKDERSGNCNLTPPCPPFLLFSHPVAPGEAASLNITKQVFKKNNNNNNDAGNNNNNNDPGNNNNNNYLLRSLTS